MRGDGRWLWRHHVRPAAISKFGTGLAAIHPELPADKWHRIITEHWQTPTHATTTPARTAPHTMPRPSDRQSAAGDPGLPA